MDPTSDILDVLTCVQGYTSKTIVYSRGATTDSVTATQQASIYTIDSGEGVFQTTAVVDWLVELSDLPIATPEYGDLITDGSDVYQVLGRGGIPPFDNVDQLGLIIKVHTGKIS